MPHIIIEYSQACLNNNKQAVLDTVFEQVTNSGLFNNDNIKLRLMPVRQYKLAASLDYFMHINCRIHPGRTAEQKQLLSKQLLDCLSTVCKSRTVITVEVTETLKDFYRKTIID